MSGNPVGTRTRDLTLTRAGLIATFPRRPECGHIVCLPLEFCVYVEGSC